MNIRSMHVYDVQHGMYNRSNISGFLIWAALEAFTINVAQVWAKTGMSHTCTHISKYTHKYTHTQKYKAYYMAHLAYHRNK